MALDELGDFSGAGWVALGVWDGDGDGEGACAQAVESANPLTAAANMSFLIIFTSVECKRIAKAGLIEPDPAARR